MSRVRMRKLRDAEIRLLIILRDENTYVYMNPHGNAFIGSRIGDHIRWLRKKTIHNLNHLGLIENITLEEWRWRGSRYSITQAGLDAIEGES